MKPTHLLASAAVAAMLCGTASAQYTQATTYGTQLTTSTNNATAATNAVERLVIASHVSIPSLPSSTLQVVLTPAGSATQIAQWTNPGAATFTVNLQNAVFSSAVNSASITAQGPGCGQNAGDIIVTSGGTVGSNSVAFTIANIAACNNTINFTSANGVQLTATGANFSTTLIRQLDGSTINGGAGTTAGAAGAFVQQAPAITFSGTAVLPSRQILLAAPTYTTLGGPTGPFNLNVSVWTTTIAGTAVNVRRNLTALGATSQPVGAALVNAATAALNLTSTTGLDTAASTIGVPVFGAANSADISAAFGTVGTNALPVVVVPLPAPGAAILSQNVSVTPSLSMVTASGVPAATYAPVPVGRLSRQGQQSLPFVWVGDGVTTSAVSVFRHTGVGSSAPVVRFLLANASGGASFNGEYVIPAANLTLTNGELVTSSLTLSQVAGNFGRADVTFVFDRAVGSPINTARFVQSPTGALTAAPETQTPPPVGAGAGGPVGN